MNIKLLTERNLELLSLKGGCTGSSESTLAKIPHCWKSQVAAQMVNFFQTCYTEAVVASGGHIFYNSGCVTRQVILLTLTAPKATKLVCFSRLLKCL